ncbi:MAG: helix-turn-helix transcriptional regulator [Spirochaetota bacterium]|nr:MAG: helix-turn-helix transcriptional regulator [Spirochaetota bacterium]
MDLDSLEMSTRQRIGNRIKSERLQLNYSLSDLANKSGVSASTIHKIENYSMVPTVMTLLKIAHGLDRDLHFFVSDTDSMREYNLIRHNEGTITRIQRQRSLFRAVSSKLAGTRLEVLHCTIEKGGNSGRENLLHDNEEIAICLKGKAQFIIGKERVILESMDSLHIKRGISHRWKNAWENKTELLFIFTPPLLI